MPASRILAVAALVVSAGLSGCRQVQDGLLYYPTPRSGPLPPPANGYSIEPLAFTRDEGIVLRGWLVKPADTIAPLLVYFGGNAEEASWLIAMADRFGGRAIALVNYRGYGESTGRPSEAALLADATAVYDALRARPDVDATQVAVMGRSLGSGVAVHVAANRAVDRVVLVSPYDSVAAVAAVHFPATLVRWVLYDRYDSAALAPTISTPLLVIAGARDDIIPIEHSRRLYALWGGDKHWLELPGAGHNDLQEYPQYWPAIATFVKH
jgi:uncharacterized protein